MTKILYVIPGWKERCESKRYLSLKKAAQKKGYQVVFHDVDWSKPLSLQLFPVPQDAVIFGFSLGAVLAWLIAQKYPCRHLILASMTPYYSFKDQKIKKMLIEITGKKFVADIVKNFHMANRAKKRTIMYGDLEKEIADILVPHTGHELSGTYIKEVIKIL